MSYRNLSLFLLTLSAGLFGAPEKARFAIYLGGAGADHANAVAIDSEGSAYVAGQMARSAGRSGAFVAKAKADGSEVVWTAQLPGDSANTVAVDLLGNVWAAGDGFLSKLNAENGRVLASLESEPVLAMAVDPAGAVYTAGAGYVAKYAGQQRVYLARIAGLGRAIAVDSNGAAYVVHGEALTRLNADGSSADYTIALGWPATAVAVDQMGAAYVTGANARLAKVNPAGDALAFEIAFGGVLEQEGRGIALDAAGNVFVAGWTNSSDFARTRTWRGERDGFVVKVSPDGEVLEATLAGTAARDSLHAIAVSPAGDVYAAGFSEGAGLGSGPLAQLQGGTDAVLLKFAGEANRALTNTTTVLTTSAVGSAALGQPLVLTATVSPAGATGKVTFYDGVNVIAVATLTGGAGSATTILLPSGSRTLRAYYGGDVNFSASLSANVTLSVAATPSLALSPIGGTTTAVGALPAAVAVADFNGDGRADLAVANVDSNSITVLLSNGAGGFTPAAGSPLSAASGPRSVVAGDFNEDGRADIAVVTLNTNFLRVYLGNGSGGFTPNTGTATSVTGGPYSLATADFNADGHIDIVTANFADGKVGVLLGNGAGAFTAAPGVAASVPQPTFVAVADFNKDGRADVAVTDFLNSRVHILLGTGSGTFTTGAGSPYSVSGAVFMVAVADFNSDGNADLAVANASGPSLPLLVGSGTGTFTASTTGAVSSVTSARWISALDFNADGKTDLAVANDTAGTVALLTGSGTGSFTNALGSPYSGYTGISSLGIGDFNGDGRVDILAMNAGGNTVSTVLGVGATPLVVSGTPPGPTTTPQTITFKVSDADGYANLSRLYFLVNPTATIPQNTCHGFYDRAANSFYLFNDNLTVLLGPLAAGSGGTIQNSQCIVYGTGSGLVSGAGNDLIVNLRMGMLGLYATTTENVYLWAVDNQALGTGWVQTGSWVLGAPIGNAAPTIVSFSPTAATTNPQTFTFTARDANGSANFDRIFFLINPTTPVPVNSCHGFYDRDSNAVYLFNDSLTTLIGPLVPGSGGSISNSQCSVNGPSTTLISGTGTDLTLSLGFALLGNYGTISHNVYLYATDKQGNGTGWLQRATWGTTGPVAPTIVSGTPASTTANPQTFTFTTRDLNGAVNLDRIYFLVNSSNNVPVNTCHGFYDRASNTVYLFNDALTALAGPLTPGVAGTISNSQCSISGATSALVSSSGTDLVLSLGMTLLGSYATAPQNVYVWAVDLQAQGTGWVQTSTWGGGGGQAPPTLVSTSPASPTGSPQAFTVVARDTNGFTDISRIYFQVYSSPTVPANSCHGFYDRASNALVLYNDALTVALGPLTPGGAGTVSNSQCTLNAATSTPVTASGTDLTVTFGLSLNGTYGLVQQKVYFWVTDAAATGTGWVQGSTWNSSTGASAPTLVSATPSATTAASQTFTLTARDANGVADLQRIYFLVNTNTGVPAATCHGFYDRATNAVYLFNDATTAIGAPLVPGGAGTIQNSQCAINGAASSVSLSGTDAVLSLNITRQGSYATGVKNLYVWVVDNANTGTGWVQASTWTR